MNKKKLGKVTGVAAASFLIAGTTALTAFAAMPSGTAVIGDKAYDLNYVNDPANEAEIVAAMQKANFKVYVKDFAGNWIVNETETALTDLSVIPVVEYKNAKGEVVKYDAKDGDIITDELKVTGVSAINNTDLKVTLNGALKEATIDKDDFKVKVNDSEVSFNVKKVSDLEYTLELIVPLNENDKVEVSGLSDLEGSSASTVYKTLAISKVEAVASTVYDTEAGQYLAVKVDGREMTASDLAKQGYEVTFQADAAVFPSASTTSTTGLIDGNAVALAPGKPFKYKVTVTKDNTVLESSYAEVSVYDKSKTAATSISDVTIKTTAIDSITSGKVVVGEAGLSISEVYADLLDGRKNVDLIALTGTVEFESSDVTIATVSATGAITTKKAGDVDITVKSGTAKKVVRLKVVNESRKLNTITYSGTTVKMVKGGSAVAVTVTAKDQYGDMYDTTNIATDVAAVEATASGKDITSTTAIAVKTATLGSATVTITPSTTDIGSGQVKIVEANGSKTLASIPVSVVSPTSAVTNDLTMNRTTIDLSAEDVKNPSITFTLKEYLSGSYSKDIDLQAGSYTAEIYDADKNLIYKAPAASAAITLTKADLIIEDDTKINQTSADVDTALTAGTASIANFETGTGLIKIFNGTGVLVASKNFTITDSSANISAATFASGVDFTTANATTLTLSEILSSISTTKTSYDGVIRYEALGSSTDTLTVYFDKSATPDGYKYEDGDIILGTVTGTGVGTNNITFASVANYLASNVTIDSSALATVGEKVQFNVNKRGDVSVAKTIITRK